MGIFDPHILFSSMTVNTDPVTILYLCVAAALGFDSKMEAETEPNSRNQTVCFCTTVNNSTSANCSRCYNPCSSLFSDFGAVFASISYLLLLISSIQLILVMVNDSLQEDKMSRWRKAFRVTIQKCLLGAVILATGSRAIYYTVQGVIPDKWGDILLNIYYPSFLSAFSLLICFWAEFFYTSSNLEGQDFLKKHKYSVTYLAFNIIVYLLLLADIIATPLISDQEQIRMSGIIGTIFAFFLFMTLVGFLHFAIRLFFRPDWQPLFVQLAVLRINLRQQLASVLGVVSNALMQSLIICLLIFNMVVRYIPVNSYNLYVCAVVIRVTELILPIWFCCSLWNFKQPKRLWILNPGLILKQDQKVDDVESKPLLAPHSSSQARYGTISVGSVDSDGVSVGSAEHEDGRCWVCLGNDNPSDLFYPCNCQLHRKCIKQWVAKRASDANIPEKEYMKCQVCRRKYRVKKDGFLCCFRGMQRRHWLQLMAAGVLVLCSVIGLILFGVLSALDTKKKVLIICCVAIFEAAVVKFLGIRMAMVLRKANHGRLDIQGYTVAECRSKREEQRRRRKRLHQAYKSRGSSERLAATGGANTLVVHYDAAVGVADCTGKGGVGEGSVEVVVGRWDQHSPVQSTVISVEVT